MTGDDEIFESDVYDDDVVISWITAREYPGVTGDNSNHDKKYKAYVDLKCVEVVTLSPGEYESRADSEVFDTKLADLVEISEDIKMRNES